LRRCSRARCAPPRRRRRGRSGCERAAAGVTRLLSGCALFMADCAKSNRPVEFDPNSE
jgi:hypothetical protein